MTQVPPTRNSSAIITLAPWPAAIRAARTPPEPAPITNRSTSGIPIVCSVLSLDLFSSFPHLGAELGDDLVHELVRPLVDVAGALIEDQRLLRDDLAADRRLVECQHVLELLLGELRRIKARAIVEQLRGSRRELSLQLGRHFVEILAQHWIGLQEQRAPPLNDPGNDRVVDGVSALREDDFLGQRERIGGWLLRLRGR